MILQIIFWLYLANAILLILHEMDSAYWKEWELFGIPGGIGGFLLIHVPLYAALLYGLIPVWRGDGAGMILSLVVGAAGLAAFFIHRYFLWARQNGTLFGGGNQQVAEIGAYLVRDDRAVGA